MSFKGDPMLDRDGIKYKEKSVRKGEKYKRKHRILEIGPH